jgi:hypothetical protein
LFALSRADVGHNSSHLPSTTVFGAVQQPLPFSEGALDFFQFGLATDKHYLLGIASTMNTSTTRTCLLVLSFVGTLVACAGVPIAEIQSALVHAKQCCATYQTISFAPLEAAKRHKFDIDPSSPVFQSPEGIAYFSAFLLPPGTARLEVQTLASTGFLPKATYADPLLVMLDAQYQQVAVLSDLRLVRSPSGFWGTFHSAIVTVPASSRYVVVFARPNSSRTHGTFSDNGTRWWVPSAPVGTIALIPS